MLNLIFTGIVGLIIIFALTIIIQNKPDFWFWFFLNLFFDPGGFVEGFLGGNLIGPLNISDVIIVGIVICVTSSKVNWKVIFADKSLMKFIFYFLLFSAYYYIIYGGIVPYFQNDFDYQTFLIKNRLFAYGFIILISVYVFSLRGLKYFYTITLSIGIICLSLYLITLITGFKLIFVWEIPREETGMMRISLLSYGLFYLMFPLALTAYLLSRKISLNLKYKHLLYYGGIIMIITLLITLTRRTQIEVIGSALIIALIISYLFRTAKLLEMFKLVIPVILVGLALFFTFPKYIDYISRIGEDTFLLITTGKGASGEGDYRVSGSGDLDVVKKYINTNLLFGTGYTYLHWGDKGAISPRGDTYAKAADAAHEVPIYYLFFGFGIVGAILMLPLYFMMGKLFFKLIKLLRLTLINYSQDPITIIFSIYILLTIAGKFTYKLWSLSQDFSIAKINETAVLMGIGFALYRKLILNTYTELQ